MHRIICGVLLVAVMTLPAPTLAAREYILATTKDGRQVALYPDGTWEYIQIPAEEAWTSYLQFTDFRAQHFQEDYRRDILPSAHLRFFFGFKNLTDKTVLGIIFRARYWDVFGEIRYSSGLMRIEEVIPPGKSNNPSIFWYYEDYQDAYNKLRWLVESGTLKVTVNVYKVAFSDGTVIEFPGELWIPPATASADSSR